MAEMTALDLVSYLSRVGNYDLDGLTIEVCTINARVSYGVVQVQITPKYGTGTKWVPAGLVKMKENK